MSLALGFTAPKLPGEGVCGAQHSQLLLPAPAWQGEAVRTRVQHRAASTGLALGSGASS